MARRTRPIIPSQRPSRAVPFMPGTEQDISQQGFITEPHETGPAPPSIGYVVTSFDARPVMAVDFQTQSGSDARDTGYIPEGNSPDPYDAASVFYTVPRGFQAILRDYQILMIPATGEPLPAPGPAGPIFGANGESNFRIVISVLVNGTFQQGMSGIVSYAGAFGDIFGECYVLANENDTIEFRVTTNSEASSFWQMLINLHGNLLLSQTRQLEFAPSSRDAIPVTVV